MLGGPLDRSGFPSPSGDADRRSVVYFCSAVLTSVLSITLVPVLMTVFIRGRRLRPESANPIARFFTWLYAPVLRLALGWRWTALVVNFAVVPLTLPLLFTIGSEFMPPLYEGSMLYMPTAPPGLSVGEATRVLQVQDKLLRQFPEVERVFGTVGRTTTSTDNSRWAWSTPRSRSSRRTSGDRASRRRRSRVRWMRRSSFLGFLTSGPSRSETASTCC